MKLPEFSEFINTIKDSLTSDVTERLNTAFAAIEPGNTAKIYAEIAMVGADFSLKLLREYHKWLAAYLEAAG